MRRMTRRRATETLIRAAGKYAAGAGQGLHSVVAEAEKQEIARAVARLWRDAYDFDPDWSSFANLGLRLPEKES